MDATEIKAKMEEQMQVLKAQVQAQAATVDWKQVLLGIGKFLLVGGVGAGIGYAIAGSDGAHAAAKVVTKGAV